VIGATGVSAAVGVPLVAVLLAAGGWRLPFAVVGMAALIMWVLLWVWCPRRQPPPGQAPAFLAHYREVSADVTCWYVLAANALQQMVFFGLFGYLAAYLMQTYQLPAGARRSPWSWPGRRDRGRRVGWAGRGPSRRRPGSPWRAGAAAPAALVFPGQASPRATLAGVWRRRARQNLVDHEPTVLLGSRAARGPPRRVVRRQ
jgi:MFS family permease